MKELINGKIQNFLVQPGYGFIVPEDPSDMPTEDRELLLENARKGNSRTEEFREPGYYAHICAFRKPVPRNNQIEWKEFGVPESKEIQKTICKHTPVVYSLTKNDGAPMCATWSFRSDYEAAVKSLAGDLYRHTVTIVKKVRTANNATKDFDETLEKSEPKLVWSGQVHDAGDCRAASMAIVKQNAGCDTEFEHNTEYYDLVENRWVKSDKSIFVLYKEYEDAEEQRVADEAEHRVKLMSEPKQEVKPNSEKALDTSELEDEEEPVLMV